MQQHVSLAKHSTMRLGGPARYLVELHDKHELPKLVAWARQHSLGIIMIGDGSNIVWKDEGFDGLVIVNRLMDFEIIEDADDASVRIGAGENWDEVVRRCCEKGLNGIAELSLIPGTAGATPIQNVGAYGREISDVLVELEAYDLETNEFVTIASDECEFGYRTSRFKTTDKDRYLITQIELQLSRSTPQPPFYASVEEYFADNQITNPSVMDMRNAVIAIRSAKLPDPNVVANNGSFFANPIISGSDYEANELLAGIRSWELEDGRVKLSAAALIEAAGFKDFHDISTGMATWPKQALVLVNESAKTTQDLLVFRQKILDGVKDKFGIELMQEPELLPI